MPPLPRDVAHRGWFLARQRHLHTDDGTSVDECDLSTGDGEHVAAARQLRRILA